MKENYDIGNFLCGILVHIHTYVLEDVLVNLCTFLEEAKHCNTEVKHSRIFLNLKLN